MRLTCNEDIGSSILSLGTKIYMVELNTSIRSSTMLVYKCLSCNKEVVASRQKLNKYCSIGCQKEFEYRSRVREWILEGRDWTGKVPNWVRRALKEKFGCKCSKCQITDYNNIPIVLEVDHVDGNHTNNTIENLRFLCPNCHSQTLTYKNRNAGNGRTSRRKQLN